MSSQFHKDLEKGRPAEVAVRNRLQHLFPDAEITLETDVEDRKHRDIKFVRGGKTVNIEVKTDFMAARTTNLALEECRVEKGSTSKIEPGWLLSGAYDGATVMVWVIPDGSGSKFLYFRFDHLIKVYDALKSEYPSRQVVGKNQNYNMVVCPITSGAFIPTDGRYQEEYCPGPLETTSPAGFEVSCSGLLGRG